MNIKEFRIAWPKGIKRRHRWLLYAYLILACVLGIAQLLPFAIFPLRYALLFALLVGVVWAVVGTLYEFVLWKIFEPYFKDDFRNSTEAGTKSESS